MAQQPHRPASSRPLKPYEKVGILKIDMNLVNWLSFYGTTILLCIELAVFMIIVFLGKGHTTLDAIIAWTGMAWYTTIAVWIMRMAGAAKTNYPGP